MELRAFDYERNFAAIDALLQLACERAVPRTSSGLVELQRLFAKARENPSLGKTTVTDQLSVQEAQAAALRIAQRFGLFECDQCAIAIAKALGKSFPLTFERLRTADDSDIIGLLEEGIQVSRNRFHVGVRVGDKIFDNHHHDGVAASKWAQRFTTVTDAPLVQESRPVSAFFGKVFLTRKFNRWACGG
jgi:hypothetical protein